MDREQYLDALTHNSARVADAAEVAGMLAPVPQCPGWMVNDLLRHLVSGDLWARTIVEQTARGVTERVDRVPGDESLDDDSLVDAFRRGAAALVDALTAADPASPAWTFSASDRTVAFWVRRRAHETTVHRHDAEAAAGTPSPIDTQLAVDGIGEFLGVFLPMLSANVVEALADIGDATIHLHCTDTDTDTGTGTGNVGEWLIARQGQELVVTAEHTKGDVAARGSASDLLLFLWGRVPADELEVFGDAELLATFRQGIRV